LIRSIEVQVLRVRPKLEIDPSAPRAIQTERRVGYVFRTALKMMRMWRADYNRNHIRPGGDDPVGNSCQIQRVVSRVNSRTTASVALKWTAGVNRPGVPTPIGELSY
jgi:hypothetical protein